MNASLLKKDEDLRHEKEIANEIDAARKAIEQQLRDAHARIEEAEEYAKREAKRVSVKLEGRVSLQCSFGQWLPWLLMVNRPGAM